MGMWKAAARQLEQIIKEEITDKRNAGQEGKN